MIWFYDNVENVFLGKSVESGQKTKEAIDFIRSNKIKDINVNNLSKANASKKGASNFLVLFDKLIGKYRKL